MAITAPQGFTLTWRTQGPQATGPRPFHRAGGSQGLGCCLLSLRHCQDPVPTQDGFCMSVRPPWGAFCTRIRKLQARKAYEKRQRPIEGAGAGPPWRGLSSTSCPRLPQWTAPKAKDKAPPSFRTCHSPARPRASSLKSHRASGPSYVGEATAQVGPAAHALQVTDRVGPGARSGRMRLGPQLPEQRRALSTRCAVGALSAVRSPFGRARWTPWPRGSPLTGLLGAAPRQRIPRSPSEAVGWEAVAGSWGLRAREVK